MSVGRAGGENRAIEAARKAMAGPLIEGRMDGATQVLLNVTGSSNMSLAELTAAADEVRAAAHPDANIIFGAAVDKTLKGDVQVTLIATGFEGPKRGRNNVARGAGVAQSAEDAWTPPWLRDHAAPYAARPAANGRAAEAAAAAAALSTAGTRSRSARKRGGKSAEEPVIAAATTAADAGTDIDLDIPTYLRRS
jgi:cell division GTPase FtsZ